MEKAIIYTRVSTLEQVESGVSLKDQEEKLLQYCQLHDLQVALVIREEGVSASKPLSTRPGGQEMLQALSEGRAGHVVALKLDRLFRDAEDALRETKAWDKALISMHLIDAGGQSINTGRALGRYIFTILAATAEMEKNLTRERTVAALQYKKNQREAYGSTPYGFDREGDELVINAQEQQTIALIKQWRGQGWSLRRIAAALTNKGIPTKQGGQWFGSTVSYILNNKLYEDVA